MRSSTDLPTTAPLVAFTAAVAGTWCFLVAVADRDFAWWWPAAVVGASLSLGLAGGPCGSSTPGREPGSRTTTSVAAISALVMAAAAGWLSLRPGDELWAAAASMVLLAALVAPGAVNRSPAPPPDRFEVRWRRLFVGSMGAVLGGLLASWLAHGSHHRPAAVVVVWLASLGVALWSTGRSHVGPQPADRHDLPAPRLEAAVVVALTALAAALRFTGLALVPVNIDGDEGRIGLHIVDTLAGLREPLFDFGWNGFSQLAFLAQGFWMRLLDGSLETLRLGSATAGTLGVILLYVFLRQLCGWRAAVVGGLLLAVNPEHLAWSRAGLMNVQAATLVTFAMAALAGALRSGRLIWWALLGAALGGCALTYHAAKAALGVVAVVAILELAAEGRRRWAGLAVGGAVTAMVALITLAPMLPAAMERWEWYSNEIGNRFDVHVLVQAIEDRQTDRVRNHLARHVGSVLAVPVASRQAGFVPAGGLFDRTTATLVVVAPLWLLLWWRRRSARVVLVWIAVYAVASGMLTFDPPWKPRLIMALPALTAAAAMVIDLIGRRHPDDRSRWRTVVVILVTAGCVAGGLIESWRRHVEPFWPSWTTSDPGSSLIRELQDLRRDGRLDDRSVMLLGSTIHHDANLYHAHRKGFLTRLDGLIDVGDDTAVLPFRDEPARPEIVIVADRQAALLSVLTSEYPDATLRPITGQRGETLFTVVEIGAETVARHRGLQRGSDEGAALSVEQPPLHLAKGARGRWIGSVFNPKAGTRAFGVSGCEGVRIAVGTDGLRHTRTTLVAEAAWGWHPVEVTAKALAEGCELDLTWAPAADAPFEPVPLWALRPEPEVHGLVQRAWRGFGPSVPTGRPPDLWRVDPVLSYDFWMIEGQETLPPVIHEGRWTARWDGTLKVPEGDHRTLVLEFESAWTEVELGGTTRRAENKGAVIVDHVTPGSHELSVRVGFDAGPPVTRLLVKLQWIADDGTRSPIPHTALSPPSELMSRRAAP